VDVDRHDVAVRPARRDDGIGAPVYQDAGVRPQGYVVPRRRLALVTALLTLAGCAPAEPEPAPRIGLGFAVTTMAQRLPGRLWSPSGSVIVDYDFTLWITGEPAVLRRVVAVAYTRPAPFPAVPVAGPCYRQTGWLSFDRLPDATGLGPASATVTFDDGRRVMVSAPAGGAAPPLCPSVFVPVA
jgi:hypothetical protein